MNKLLAKEYVTHLGIIFSKYMIFFLIVSIISAFSFLLVITYWVLLVTIGLLSLGVLFFNEGYVVAFSKGEDIMTLSLTIAPIAAGIGLIFSLLSLICFTLDRHNPNNKSKIIKTSIISAILIITLIVVLILMQRNGMNNE